MAACAEIATWLAAQGEGTVGTNLFEHNMPSTPDSAVTVKQFGGSRGDWRMGGVLAENVMIRIECRGIARDAAELKCYSIHNKIERLANTTLSGTRYYVVAVTRPPGPLQIDQTAPRVTWYFEMSVKKARS